MSWWQHAALSKVALSIKIDRGVVGGGGGEGSGDISARTPTVWHFRKAVFSVLSPAIVAHKEHGCLGGGNLSSGPRWSRSSLLLFITLCVSFFLFLLLGGRPSCFDIFKGMACHAFSPVHLGAGSWVLAKVQLAPPIPTRELLGQLGWLRKRPQRRIQSPLPFFFLYVYNFHLCGSMIWPIFISCKKSKHLVFFPYFSVKKGVKYSRIEAWL